MMKKKKAKVINETSKKAKVRLKPETKVYSEPNESEIKTQECSEPKEPEPSQDQRSWKWKMPNE